MFMNFCFHVNYCFCANSFDNTGECRPSDENQKYFGEFEHVIFCFFFPSCRGEKKALLSIRIYLEEKRVIYS